MLKYKTNRDKFKQTLIKNKFSGSTTAQYLRFFDKLHKHTKRKDIKNLTTEDLDSFIRSLKKENLKPRSLAVAVSFLKRLYNDMLDGIPKDVEIPKIGLYKRLPEIYTDDEVKLILNNAPRKKFKIIFMLCYGCGLRLREVLNLNIDDIDSNRMMVYIRSSNKFREVRLPKYCLEELKHYYREEKPTIKLFPSKKAKSISITINNANRVLLDIKKKLGMKKGDGCISLRHTYAVRMLQNGVDPKTLKKILGIEEVSPYVSIVNKMRKDSVEIDILDKMMKDESTPWDY